MHGSDVRLARGLAPARAAYARVVRRASALTAVSSYLCAESRAMAPDVACEVAPMPVAADLFNAPPPGAPRAGVLFVGRLTRQKGVDTLLRAAAAFRAPLTICGSGPEEGALRALAAELGVEARVRWLATQSQPRLADLYREAAVVAMPSHEEGLGLVAVEAALCGTPVVGFRSGGLVDVVDDGATGFLVPPGDAGALAGALDRVTGDPALGAGLGATARARASWFAPDQVAARYRAIYDRVIADGGGPDRQG
jgi:rhamnosyl/mannosyltransferase